MCSAGSTTSARGMFDVQNIYGTPQVPRKKPCMRPRRMTLIDLRNVPLTDEGVPQRKASSGTVRSEGGLSHYSKSGIWHIHDSTDSLPSSYRGSMRSKHASESSQDGSSRFPKLEDCAHFHYDFVDFGQLQMSVCDDDRENYRHNEAEQGELTVLVRVSCNDKDWTFRRSFLHFAALDRQLHRCIFDRKFSQLPDLQSVNTDIKSSQEVEQLMQSYLKRFSELAGTMINCGSILNWLEMDNRGNRLLAVDDSGINTPAIAAAHAVKRYTAQAADEISLQVGDIVSVIDMPSSEDTIWWRGKRGFEVGFFPSACVEVIIGDKVPSSMATVMPATGSLSSSMHSNTQSTPTTVRKPCEIESAEDTASMIRKHGKLVSFLRTFFTTRPPRSQLKQSGIVKERVFGCDLGEHLLNSGHDVPVVLKGCTEVIERYGIVDGIYRLSGITSNIQKLRVAFDEDEAPELMETTYLQDIHSISSLLKMYFRELPNPLLTYQLYDKFAEAVRDEDNKLLRIHDVVQQLPPPHYRTLEYLMRHLGRVASHAMETGMHSKNLAIVWAPNLLRSKELELGGGAAALQGVGIQAVVTECLICYCDLIFNDKMPSYNSPHLQKSQKKPRPKSLAISTPTRLLSLEEARERAFLSSLAHSQRFIDVGGGPSSLPPTYHTVLDLQGYRKKSTKSSSKGKKSPVSGGWKALFRAGSVKKARKGSMQGDEKPLDSLQAKALTEEDVHNWKHRLRSAKSAESLLSMATSARSSISSQTSSSLGFSIDGSRPRESLILSGGQFSRMAQQLEPQYRQPFVRGDSTRKALHRRTPSAPNTPRLDYDRTSSASTAGAVSPPNKASSQPQLDSLSPSPVSDRRAGTSPVDTSLGVDIDAAIKARLQQMALQSRSSAKSPEQRKGNMEKRKGGVKNGSADCQSNSSQNNEQVSPVEHAKFFVSRYHDYAEIVTDDEGDQKTTTRSSTSDMQDLVEKLDCKLSSASNFYLPVSEDMTEPEAKLAKLEPERTDPAKSGLVIKRQVERVPASSMDSTPSSQVGQRKVELIPSGKQSLDQSRKVEGFSELPTRPARSADAALPPIPQNRNQRQTSKQSPGSVRQGGMTKCLSVPSDIAESLENITASQNDILSSMTLSELSQSISSFCTSAQEDLPPRDDPRWRRSTSLDSLEAESSLSRTLRDMNSQMDSTFHEKVERAIQLEEEGYSRHGDADSSGLAPLQISEDDLATPVGHEKQSLINPCVSAVKSPSSKMHPHSQEAVSCPAPLAKSPGVGQNVPCYRDSPVMAQKQSKSDSSFNAHPEYPDYAVIRKRPKTSKEDRGPGFYSGQGVVEGSRRDTDSSPDGTLTPVTVQPFEVENTQSDCSLWPEGGEAYAESVHSLSSASSHSLANMRIRPNGEPKMQNRMLGSDMSLTRSDASIPRSNTSNPRSDSSVSNSDFHLDQLSQSELSAGLCVVKRQHKSSSLSSGSTSSSDVDDNSDDSIEIVHQAQPVDSQFALKLSRKQRAAESMPPPNSLSNSNPVHVMESAGMPVPANSPKVSADNALWKQGSAFGKSEQSSDGRMVEFRNWANLNPCNANFHQIEQERVEPLSPVSLGKCDSASEALRTYPHHVKPGEDFAHHQPAPSDRHDRMGLVYDSQSRSISYSSDHKPEPTSPRQRTLSLEGRPRASSQSDSMLKFQREDLPIISGNMPVSPASQQSPTVSPRLSNICSPHGSQLSRLPSPRSPVISSSAGHQSHIPSLRPQFVSSPPASQKSSIPSLHSPPVSSPQSHTPPQVSSPQSHTPPQSAASSAVPLHLMLYHPDEFKIPAAAMGLKPPASSLPQVHVKSDTVTEEKAVIRKGGSSRAATEKQGSGVSLSGGSPQQQTKTLTASERLQGPSDAGMQMGKTEQESMEVNNLCNRLVDELQSVHSQPAHRDHERDHQQSTAGPGGVHTEAAGESCAEEMEVGMAEQRFKQGDNFGTVQDEEMENALNTGREMLLSHSSSSSSSTPSIVTTTTAAPGSPHTPSPAKSAYDRRPSASKIPRFHKRTDSREDKNSAVEGDVSQHSPRLTGEEKSAASDICKSEASPNMRLHKQSHGHEEKNAASDSPGKVSQHSRLHKRTNSKDDKGVASDVSQGSANRSHRRTQSQEEKRASSGGSHGETAQQQRLHRRTNSREEREVSSNAGKEHVTPSSKMSVSSGSRTADKNRTGVGPKSKDNNDSGKGSPRISKIPLSHKAPSPTNSSREPKASKAVTSPSTARSTASPVNRSQNQTKAQPSPVPRARLSIHKSDHVAPPPEEVMEVSRPSVKKRTVVNQKSDKRTAATGAKENRTEKNVIVQEIKMDKGDAKLVIEKQSNLKKKIQTVHARKVPHPTRQIAEALDTDTCDSSPAELSSTGPSDMEHSGMSSQEDEVFSDENMRFHIGRNRSYSSGIGVRSPCQPLSLSPCIKHKSEVYHQMAASRSSLDDSALQLAAERQDDLILGLSNADGVGYSTGSLRSCRSQKMRNLMEVFEKGGCPYSGEESGDTKGKERSDSTSGSTTISAGSQERGLDTDDDIFRPPHSPNLFSSMASRRSRSRDRGGGRGKAPSPHRRPSQSPTARRLSLGRGEESIRRRRQSPASHSSVEVKSQVPKRTEGGVNIGRPPRYRSSSRSRTYSDSSTSESDNTLKFDSSRSVINSPSRPRGLPRGQTGRREDTHNNRAGKSEESGRDSLEDPDEKDEMQRRGSIKELRQLFEKNPTSENSESDQSPPLLGRRSVRTRSVSPGADSSSPAVTPNIMRRSLEIPRSSAVVKQPLRLGPKPFYGTKK